MQSNKLRNFLLLSILVSFLTPLNAEDLRSFPLDMYLIIDGSSALRNSKNDTIAWIGSQVVDRILIDGDRISIWTAGDRAELIHSETISGNSGKNAVKEKLQALDPRGTAADFSGALRDVESRVSQTPQNRLAYTMLVTASAEGLEPMLTGNSQNLLRWFRSEKYERWQVLIVAPDIGRKVQQAAAAYMSTR